MPDHDDERGPMDNTQDVPCSEYIDIGPFRFECSGHLPGYERRARDYHGGKVTHYATSPQAVGDVDVTFWTRLSGRTGAATDA